MGIRRPQMVDDSQQAVAPLVWDANLDVGLGYDRMAVDPEVH